MLYEERTNSKTSKRLAGKKQGDSSHHKKGNKKAPQQ